MGSKPLLRGKKAPPQPPIEPQKIGPKIGIVKSDAGNAAPAAPVNFVTTDARNTSKRNTEAA